MAPARVASPSVFPAQPGPAAPELGILSLSSRLRCVSQGCQPHPPPSAAGIKSRARRVTPESRPRMSLPRRFRRGVLWVAGRGLLATTMAGDVGGRSCTDSELLLHPELLSQEFLLLTLEQVGRSGPTEDGRAAGRTGRPAGGSRPLPAHTDPVGLASLASPKETSREWLESPGSPR